MQQFHVKLVLFVQFDVSKRYSKPYTCTCILDFLKWNLINDCVLKLVHYTLQTPAK